MGEYHDFAMLISVDPQHRLRDWETVLRSATPPPGMSVCIRTPQLLYFAIRAEHEFVAIEKAEMWLSKLKSCLREPFTLRFNAQPSEEI